jgi:hypothetical protein
MKMTRTKEETLRLDEFPFIQELIVCGINALIEVKELPVEKLRLSNTIAIAGKLLELSMENETWLTSEDQLIHLQYIINKVCDDKLMLQKVMTLCEQKFDFFLKQELT